MDETNALVLIAEVAISVAGFSGIATALEARYDGVGWAESRRSQFVYMLSQSAIALFAALLTLVSLYRIPEGEPLAFLWRMSSGVWALFAMCGTMLGFLRGRRLPTPDGAQRFVGPVVFLGFGVLIWLQLYNVLVLQAFWPFLAGLVGNLAFAFLQFTRIVLPEGEKSPAEESPD